MLAAPLGPVGASPILLAFDQPFGFNAILGMVCLSGILMPNSPIPFEQIEEHKLAGLDDCHAFVEETVQQTRPVTRNAKSH